MQFPWLTGASSTIKPISKILLVAVLIATMILVVSTGLTLLFLDLNDYKGTIAASIKSRTGLDVRIDGDIRLSIFPDLNLSTGRMLVNNPAAFKESAFIALDNCDLQLRWLPLLQRKVEIKRLDLDGLTVHLIKDKRGLSNWAMLVAQQPSANATQAESASNKAFDMLSMLSANDIKANKVLVIWDDKENNRYLDLNNIELAIDHFAIGKPSAIELTMDLTDKADITGRLKITATLQTDPSLARLTVTDSYWQWHNTDPSTSTLFPKAVINAPKAVVNLDNQTVDFSNLNLAVDDFKFSAELNGSYDFDKNILQSSVHIQPFNLAAALNKGGYLPKLNEVNILKIAKMNFNLYAKPDSLEFNSLDMVLDESKIKGSVKLTELSQVKLRFNETADAIHADRYLPKSVKSTRKKINSRPIPDVTALTSSLDWLKKQPLEGKLVVGTLTLNGATLKDAHLQLGTTKYSRQGNKF